MTHLQVIYIEWRDSCAAHGWDAYEAYKEFPSTFSTGILIKEELDHYAIAHSYDPDSGDFNGIMRIPLIAVIKAKTLCVIQIKK